LVSRASTTTKSKPNFFPRDEVALAPKRKPSKFQSQMAELIDSLTTKYDDISTKVDGVEGILQ
jgi:hypothetical protein